MNSYFQVPGPKPPNKKKNIFNESTGDESSHNTCHGGFGLNIHRKSTGANRFAEELHLAGHGDFSGNPNLRSAGQLYFVGLEAIGSANGSAAAVGFGPGGLDS